MDTAPPASGLPARFFRATAVARAVRAIEVGAGRMTQSARGRMQSQRQRSATAR
jgi:hypothetical protein